MRGLFILLILYLIMAILPTLAGAAPIDSITFTTTVLGFLLLASLFFGKVTEKFGLPMITGYLIAGMVFGPYGFRLFDLEHIGRLDFINHLALSLIALSAGAELDWKNIKARFKPILFLALSQVVVVFTGVFAIFYAIFSQSGLEMVSSPEFAFYAALLLAVISTANSPSSAVAVINESRAQGPVSLTVLGVSVLKDVLVIALFAFTASFVQSSSQSVGPFSFSSTGKDIFVSLFLESSFSVIAGVVIGLIVIFYLKKLRKERLLFTLGLAVICGALSQIFHLNALLLCITVGFIVRNFLEDGGGFQEWLESSSMPVFVIFFSLTGASLNLKALALMWPAALGLFGLRMALIWISTYGSSVIFKEPPEVRKRLWSGFIAQAGVSLGLAVIVEEQFPVWGSGLVTLIVAGIALNQVVGPVLFKFSLIASGEARKIDYNSGVKGRK